LFTTVPAPPTIETPFSILPSASLVTAPPLVILMLGRR
jgi:hypothetical protein